MSAKSHRKPRAGGGNIGGSTKPNIASGAAPEVSEVMDTKDKFKRGGKAKGGKSEARLDRKPRASGGRAGGASPFSQARKLSTPQSGKDGQGHEDAGPKGSENPTD